MTGLSLPLLSFDRVRFVTLAADDSTPPLSRRNRVLITTVTMLLVCSIGLYTFVAVKVIENADETAARAERMLRTGDSQAARDELSWLLYFEADSPAGLLVLAKCQRAENQPAEAISTLKRIPLDVPQGKPAQFLLAEILLEENRLVEAEAALVESLDRFPDSAQAAEELRWLYFNQFRMRDVERLIEQQLQIHPNEPSNLIHALMTEFRPPVPREGVGYLRQIESAQPAQFSVLRALAYCEWQLGDLQQAREHFQSLLAERPDDLQTNLMLAEFAIEQNQLPLAEQVLNKIENSHDDRVLWIESLLLDRQGELERSLSAVSQASKLRPWELKYVYHRATLMQRLQQSDAADAFVQAKELEAAERTLAEIVLSGTLDELSPELCLEIAQLHDRRHQPARAERWRMLARQAQVGDQR